MQLAIKQKVALRANDAGRALCISLHMPHQSSPNRAASRLHFIPEWAEKRGLSQADIVRALGPHGVDKSQVSRWFKGKMPRRESLDLLARLFELEDVHSLLRHPDDDWITRLLQGRSAEDRARARQMLELLFSQRVA